MFKTYNSPRTITNSDIFGSNDIACLPCESSFPSDLRLHATPPGGRLPRGMRGGRGLAGGEAEIGKGDDILKSVIFLLCDYTGLGGELQKAWDENERVDPTKCANLHSIAQSIETAFGACSFNGRAEIKQKLLDDLTKFADLTYNLAICSYAPERTSSSESPVTSPLIKAARLSFVRSNTQILNSSRS